MARGWLSAAAVLLLVSQTANTGSSTEPPATCQAGGTCGQYGTSVHFVSTPSEAGGRAEKEEKLVLVLHLSGYFEDPRFT